MPQHVVAKKVSPGEGCEVGLEGYVELAKEGKHPPGRENNVGEDPELCNNMMDCWEEAEHREAGDGSKEGRT